MEFFGTASDSLTIEDGMQYIIGFPSSGNIGQTALDIMVATIMLRTPENIKFIGVAETESLIPVVGLESYGQQNKKHLSHPMEFYRIVNSKIVLVLIRSICHENEERIFADELIQFLKNHKYSSAILLTGANPEEWDVNYMMDKAQFFIFSDQKEFSSFPNQTEQMIKKTWIFSSEEPNLINQSNQFFPYGMELASEVLKKLNTNVMILGKFSVGMGSQMEAMELPRFILSELRLIGKDSVELSDLHFPQSWIEQQNQDKGYEL
jgi:hypothetical protein